MLISAFDAASFSLGLPSPPAGTAAENDDEKAAEGDAAPTGKGQQQHIAPLNISAEMAVHEIEWKSGPSSPPLTGMP